MLKKSKFLFKLILSSSLVLGLPTSALALPGMQKQQALNWAKKHKYFASWVQLLRSENHSGTFLAYRQLDKNRFLDVYLVMQPYRSNTLSVEEVILSVRNKEYTGQSDDDRMDVGGLRWVYDKRPWQTQRCENIWSRNNPQARSFLTQVFSADIAKDFANAKLVYSGPTFIDGPDENYAVAYYPDTDLYKVVGSDYEGNPLPKENIVIARERVDVLKGQRFAYFVQDAEYGPSPAFDALQVKCSSLVIRPLSGGDRPGVNINKTAATLSTNKKIYESR